MNTAARKLKLTMNGNTAIACLANNVTAEDFVSMLPLSISMKDRYKREKNAVIPGLRVAQTHAGYAAGDIAYHAPTSTLVIYFINDNDHVSTLATIGQIESGIDMFIENPGTVELTLELMEG